MKQQELRRGREAIITAAICSGDALADDIRNFEFCEKEVRPNLLAKCLQCQGVEETTLN